jgi:AAHS family 4-hydroxybenzoate transporter-like MFS transporter
MDATRAQGSAIDIGEALDTGPWSGLQKALACLAALAVLLDGFDNQLIGFAIPVIIKEWHVTRGDFAPVVACGLIGMAVGSFFAGRVGDRLGRRTAVYGSLILLGLATLAVGFAQNLLTLGALRFVAGLGVGGALPTATTLTAEFTPARHRTMVVTATITCVPLGGMVAGLFAGYVLPGFGWRALFWVGGLLPALLGLVFALALPESPRLMARRRERWPELAGLLSRMGRPTASGTTFTDLTEQRVESRASVGALFEPGRRRDTLALWGSCFLCLLAVYSAFSWLPTMLAAQGLDVSTAGAGLTAYNFGGVIGALVCATAITRFGSRWPQILCALGATASALALEWAGLGNTGVMVFWLGLHGLFVNAVQSTLYAVAAHTYPTNIRATGTATAIGFGRLGAVLSSFVGAAVISAAGPNSYLSVLAVAMLGTALFLALLRHHIPASGPTAKPSAAVAGKVPT